MTFNEYYEFPEGINATHKYMLSDWYNFPEAQLPVNSEYLFTRNPAIYLCPWDVSNVTNMSYMLSECKNLTDISALSNWNVSNVTTMSYLFNGCTNLSDISALSNWNVSNVTNISYLFNGCSNLTSVDLSNWDTSKVTNMSHLVYNISKFTTFGPIDCSSISSAGNYPLYLSSNSTSLVNLGGFLNMKTSWNNNYGLYRCPNLTYESCINVLNGLYDFTGNGLTPNSSQGQLKVNANFLTTVGDKISIGTDKGWTITS